MLKFYFSPQDDTLEARFEGGFIGISQTSPVDGDFKVYGYAKCCMLDLGTYPDIYEALKAANDYFNDPCCSGSANLSDKQGV